MEEVYHALTVEEALRSLDSRREGLATEEVRRRQVVFGMNEIPEAQKTSWVLLFLRQFKSLLIAVLLVAAVIALAMGHLVDMYVIFAVIFINASIGFFQELRAENAVAALKRMLVQQARVLRDGKEKLVTAKELVPGDVIVLEEGENIPADARIIEARSLRIVEASLTGESMPVGKQAELVGRDTAFAERRCMLYKGTYVASGFARAVVCFTGLRTAIGKIAETLTEIKPQRTNFQRKTDRLARQMAVIAVFSACLLFVVAYFSGGHTLDELLLISIAAMVSSIPEGLPAVLSIVLAIGSHRMAKRNAIVRELNSVETLGAVTTIVTDKTGTLTQNMLTVRKVLLPQEEEILVTGDGWHPVGNFVQHDKILDHEGHERLKKLLSIAIGSNNAAIVHDAEKDSYTLTGDPTEGALVVLAHKGGLGLVSSAVNGIKTDDLPFNSKNRFRATLFREKEGNRILVIGAPERILELSNSFEGRNGVELLSAEVAEGIQEKIDRWSSDAMRIIALAYKPTNEERLDAEKIDSLVLAGIVGMIDPPRPDAREAVEKCKHAGIRVIMATGDHINTAVAIAKAVAIIDNGDTSKVLALNESQLVALDDKEFDEAVRTVSVFSRLTPNMKLRIASRLQEMGELVAMTGDGVNDAPALKKADIGVAMGMMGTDVARNSAKLVLADDNFATIVSAVEEGRIVFTNARQTSYYLVTTNFAEIVALISVIASGNLIPLTATQILWLNLVTDGVGDISLATEKGHGEELSEKAVGKGENILNRKILPFLLVMAIVMSGGALGAYFWFLPQGIEKARTTVFIIMAFMQLFNLLNMRSLHKSVFEIGLFTNKYINVALAVSLVIQLVIIETPFFESVFGFRPVSFLEFVSLVACASASLWAGEAYKYSRRKFERIIS
ncbi:MAG: HAD-IC family P-type ATPase [Cyclobacteriaceae bacterium]|nr:HAD-IC family P-type ATPase [Cyclobacteriaceae bacterium]